MLSFLKALQSPNKIRRRIKIEGVSSAVAVDDGDDDGVDDDDDVGDDDDVDDGVHQF
jgi:hypothetical protein